MLRKLLKLLFKNKSLLYVIGVIVLIFSFLVNVLFTIQLKYDNSSLQEDIFELENRLLSANQELEKSNTDIHIHQEATKRLGLVKSDETPVNVVVKEKEEEDNNGHTEEEMKNKKLSVYIQTWYEEIKELKNQW